MATRTTSAILYIDTIRDRSNTPGFELDFTLVLDDFTEQCTVSLPQADIRRIDGLRDGTKVSVTVIEDKRSRVKLKSLILLSKEYEAQPRCKRYV